MTRHDAHDGGPVPLGGAPAPEDDPLAALLRDAMAESTAALPAGGDGLADVRARIARQRRRRRVSALVGLAAAAVAVVLITLPG